jgi:phenol hydroxylase P0 protein
MGEVVRAFDPEQRYVRITGIRDNQLVEFDFAIGEPALYVELVLPLDAFQEFCARNRVRFLSAEDIAAVDADKLKWRYGRPGGHAGHYAEEER